MIISTLKRKKVYSFLSGLIAFILIGALACQAYAQDRAQEEEMEKVLVKMGKACPFGVLEFLHWNHSWNNFKYPDKGSLDAAVALMKEAGVCWVRMDFLWQDIEPRQGKLNFEKYDYIVGLLNDNGIRILGLLNYSTEWASGAWNKPPKDNALFVKYASAVITRYKGRVGYWEVWNEPDDETYWAPQDHMVRYSSLLKDVYRAAKRIDPGCKILNGGLSKNIIFSLREIYKNGAGKFFDILAIHPFVNPLNEVDVARVKGLYNGCKKVMRDNADDKKIWFTELGAPGVEKPDRTNSWWLGLSPTEEEQAAWVRKVYAEILPQMPDCEVIFWAFFRDCKGHWDNGIDYFGLVRWDYSKKPAFLEYKKFADAWTGN